MPRHPSPTAQLSPLFWLQHQRSFSRRSSQKRQEECNQWARIINSHPRYMLLPGVSPSALLSSGVRLSKPVELSLSKGLIVADNFPWKTSFAKTLDMSSTVLAFKFTNFPWMNLISFSKRSKSPCHHRFNLHSIAALCFLLLEVVDGFCRIMVCSTINVFKATEFRSEFELNCFIQNVSSSTKAFPALPYSTLVMVFTVSS